jgi:hypothetical protein
LEGVNWSERTTAPSTERYAVARISTAAASATALEITRPCTDRASRAWVKAVNTTTSTANEPTSVVRYEPA